MTAQHSFFHKNRLENDINSNLTTFLTTPTVESASNSVNTSTINIADIPIIDDDPLRIEESTNLSDQQQKQTEETTTDEDDDEQTFLKCLKLTSEQIEAAVEEEDDDEDDDEEQHEEVKFFFSFFRKLYFPLGRGRI